MMVIVILIFIFKNLLKYFYSLEKFMPTFTGDEMDIRVDPDLSEGGSLHIWVAHDETIFESNDGKKEGWHPVNEQPLMKKSRGRSLHVSDFVTETIGWLKLSEDQKLEVGNNMPHEARIIISPGKNNDGWWNLDKLIKQVKFLSVNLVYT